MSKIYELEFWDYEDAPDVGIHIMWDYMPDADDLSLFLYGELFEDIPSRKQAFIAKLAAGEPAYRADSGRSYILTIRDKGGE